MLVKLIMMITMIIIMMMMMVMMMVMIMMEMFALRSRLEGVASLLVGGFNTVRVLWLVVRRIYACCAASPLDVLLAL